MDCRLTEIYDLVADVSKARETLGWKNTYQLKDLVKEMVENALEIRR